MARHIIHTPLGGKWGHDALAADLARHLMKMGKNWVWLNSTIGAWSGPRPDVMSYTRFRYDIPTVHAYEIKVSRSDLMADLNKGKWESYLEHCQSVTFVMPHGLAKKEEIPGSCGVMFRSSRGWRHERRPQSLGSPCSIQVMAKLLTMHPLRVKDDPGEHHWRVSHWLRDAGDKFVSRAGEKYGHALARAVRLQAEGHDIAEEAKKRADEIIAAAKAEADQIKSGLVNLLQELGVDGQDEWALREAFRKRVAYLNADERVRSADAALRSAHKALGQVVAERS